jgi:diguanylate cyclase (GGDEF)-like protein
MLDHFKSINDTHGHEAGDLVLKRFAELLRKNTRTSDMCGRLGGEEFVIDTKRLPFSSESEVDKGFFLNPHCQKNLASVSLAV